MKRGQISTQLPKSRMDVVQRKADKELVRYRRARNWVAKNSTQKGGYHSPKKYTREQKHLRMSYEN